MSLNLKTEKIYIGLAVQKQKVNLVFFGAGSEHQIQCTEFCFATAQKCYPTVPSQSAKFDHRANFIDEILSHQHSFLIYPIY